MKRTVTMHNCWIQIKANLALLQYKKIDIVTDKQQSINQYCIKPNPCPIKPNPYPIKPNPYPIKPNPYPIKPYPYPIKPNPCPIKPNNV
jgi:hypothetical protein